MSRPSSSPLRPTLLAALCCVPFLSGCDPAPPATQEAAPLATQEAAPPATRAVRAISTPDAPEAIGPYSQAVLAGSTLYLAGQIALDPETGELAQGGIEAETRQVMENLEAVLEAAGFGFGDVVQSQVFLTDLADFEAFNAIYGEHFAAPYPARATVEVARLPRDARVEVQLVAVGGR